MSMAAGQNTASRSPSADNRYASPSMLTTAMRQQMWAAACSRCKAYITCAASRVVWQHGCTAAVNKIALRVCISLLVRLQPQLFLSIEDMSVTEIDAGTAC